MWQSYQPCVTAVGATPSTRPAFFMLWHCVCGEELLCHSCCCLCVPGRLALMSELRGVFLCKGDKYCILC